MRKTVTTNREPSPGDRRIIEKFFFFPATIRICDAPEHSVRIWLERAKVQQRYGKESHREMIFRWIDEYIVE